MDEKALGITYGGKSSSFQDLLKKINQCLHLRNIQALATESGIPELENRVTIMTS